MYRPNRLGPILFAFLVGSSACLGQITEDPRSSDGALAADAAPHEPDATVARDAPLAAADAAASDAGQPQSATMRVEGRFLFDTCGEKVVMRGVNKMVVWVDWEGTARDGMPMYTEIAKTGANAVRIVWVTGEGTTAEEMDRAISNCVDQRMIPMIELHDQTCDWSHEGIQSLTDYWTRADIVEVIQRYEAYLLVNFGNEIGDWNVTDEQFKTEYEAAIQQMRAAGIRVPIIIDGTKCGQDVDVLLRNGSYLIDADPEHNLMFSVHMWWTDDNPQRVTDAIHTAVAQELPLVVGEFAHAGVGCAGAIPYRTILQECQEHEVGYFPWSWDHQNGDCAEHSMTTDSSETYETLWGWALEVAVTDPNSIQNTSVRPRSLVEGSCAAD